MAHLTRRLGALGREYVRLQPIYGVTSSHVEGTQSAQVTGAHSAVHAIPRDYFAASVARWRPEHPLARLRLHDPSLAGQLPVLVGEGTGLLDPGALTDPVPTAWRDAVHDGPAIGDVAKKTLYQPADPHAPSDFYKVVLFGATHEFLDTYHIGTFRFAHRLRDGSYSKGVAFEELRARQADVVILPYGYRGMERALSEGRIGTGVGGRLSAAGPDQAGGWPGEFTADQLAAMRAVTKTRIPPPPLTGPPVGTPVLFRHRAALPAVLAASLLGLPGWGRRSRWPVHWYYHPAQLHRRRPGLGHRMNRYLRSLGQRYPLVGHEAVREWHSAGLPEVWRVSLYFDDPAKASA